MSKPRIHGSELRQLCSLLATFVEDSDLMSEISFIEKEHIQGASLALRSLIPIVDVRDMEDTLNES
jgi:hypothetical protein